MINRLFRFTWFPLAIQLLALGGFFLLILGGFAANTSDMAFAKILRNTNLPNLIVWSYWWPLIILSAIFLGRIWCTVCPMELVTSQAARIGLKKRPPAFLRSGWIITCFYILILFIGIHTLAIHRVPYRMALYMLALFAAAVLFGLLFSRNAFCAYVCPVGHLLGLYARLAPMGWGVKDSSVCHDCEDRSCISKRGAYKFQGRSCGVGLFPAKLDDNTACILCGQCLKACDRSNPGLPTRPNPGWFRRRWFQDLLDLKSLAPAQAAFLLVVSGFIIYEIFTEWGTTEKLVLYAPSGVIKAFGISGALGHGLVTSFLLFITLPLLFWLLPFLTFRLSGGRLALSDYLLRFGIAFLPIMAGAHIIKALLKMTSRIPCWEHVLSDPRGIETARRLLDKAILLAPLPPWRDPMITILSLLLMGISVSLSIIVVHKLTRQHLPESGWRGLTFYLIPGLYGGAFSVMLIAWRLS